MIQRQPRHGALRLRELNGRHSPAQHPTLLEHLVGTFAANPRAVCPSLQCTTHKHPPMMAASVNNKCPIRQVRKVTQQKLSSNHQLHHHHKHRASHRHSILTRNMPNSNSSNNKGQAPRDTTAPASRDTYRSTNCRLKSRRWRGQVERIPSFDSTST